MQLEFIFLVVGVVVSIGLWYAYSRYRKTRRDAPGTLFLYPIGKVIKEGTRTFIELREEYEPGLRGLENYTHITVIYWFDQHDLSEKRSVLTVHPMGDPENPKRGVFATHAPMRPNLIAVSQCRILSVEKNVIEIDSIDALPDSPVLDIKNAKIDSPG
ncbi:MAG TPA: tRNA (N6-threonylcarbamoyladenosine(37)-N6)-methyltransferase TrmO [bacterium]|nr:tRNA (N6-threonylcarbamoyladenosine(37)-N6)-methyltransferase TrmO [bacterium]